MHPTFRQTPPSVGQRSTSTTFLPRSAARKGTADALWQNFDLIENERFSHILVLSGDHVYKMDYRPMIREHISSGADLTIAAPVVT